MPEVLPEAFSVADVRQSAAGLAPAAHALQVLVDSVVLPEPLALRGMTPEERGLFVDDRRDVDHETGKYRLPVEVHAADRIRVVERRDRPKQRERRTGRRLVEHRCVGNGSVEATRARDTARLFVVDHVVDRSVGEHEIRLHGSEQRTRACERRIVIADPQVSAFEAMERTAESVRGATAFFPPDRRDLVRTPFGRSTISLASRWQRGSPNLRPSDARVCPRRGSPHRRDGP